MMKASCDWGKGAQEKTSSTPGEEQEYEVGPVLPPGEGQGHKKTTALRHKDIMPL